MSNIKCLVQVVGDTASVCTSLLIKQLILFSSEYYYSKRTGTPGPNVGRGVGMAIGLFCLLVLSSLSINHYFLRSSGVGVLARSALISALYERKLGSVLGGTLLNPHSYRFPQAYR